MLVQITYMLLGNIIGELKNFSQLAKSGDHHMLNPSLTVLRVFMCVGQVSSSRRLG